MRRILKHNYLLLLVFSALAGLTGAPLAHAISFGLRGSGGNSSGAAAVAAEQHLQNATKGSCAKPVPVRAADPADPYPYPPSLEDLQDYEAWEDNNGEIHVIRAHRFPSGDFAFEEGTIVPKDPRSMARIITTINSEGEHFQCLIPALKKPLNPTWLDIPQVPVLEALDRRRAEEALKVLEGKCFYRVAGAWTYEFCYKKHVKQMRIDPNGHRVLEEILLGVYNETTPFELFTAPDRLDHTLYLDEEGPAWTTSITTVYGGGQGADQFGNGWMTLKGSCNPFSKHWLVLSSVRPRQVGIRFKCLKIQEDGYRQWLDSSNVYLDQDRVPFDISVSETALGIYQIEIRTEKLCEHDLLYQESTMELNQFGDLEEEVMCHSEETGRVYQLKDVPGDDRFWHKFKEAINPWWND